MNREELISKLREAGLSEFQATVAAIEVEKAGQLRRADDDLVAAVAERVVGENPTYAPEWSDAAEATGPLTQGPELVNSVLYAVESWQTDKDESEGRAADAEVGVRPEDRRLADEKVQQQTGDPEAEADADFTRDLVHRELLESLSQLIGRTATEEDLEDLKLAFNAKLDIPITEAFLRGAAERADPLIGQVLTEQDPFLANETMEITESRTGRKLHVGRGLYDAFLKNLPGMADYQGLYRSGWVDSINRGWDGENWYGLLALSHGLFNPNQDVGPAQQLTDFGPAREDIARQGRAPSAAQSRREYVRAKLQEEHKLPSKMPQKYLGVGKLKMINPLWKAWMNPESILADDWWEQKVDETRTRLVEFTEFHDARVNAAAKGKGKLDDAVRQMLYKDKVPQFDANMNNGMGPLAALVATHNPELAKKMMGPGINKAERALIVNKILRGMGDEQLAQLGMISDTLLFYDEDYKKLLSGGGGGGGGRVRTIIQPNRPKITEGFREMYRGWFQTEPSEQELQGLVDLVANEMVSAQHQDRESDVQSVAVQALRDTSIYGQLYGNKPQGLTEEQYIQQFQRAGASLLGGQMPTSEAVQAGMRSGSVNRTTTTVAQDKGTWQNSAWLERVYQMAELANRMT